MAFEHLLVKREAWLKIIPVYLQFRFNEFPDPAETVNSSEYSQL